MSFEKNTQVAGDLFCIIGTVYNKKSGQKEKFEMGWALDHFSGRLTNEKLMAMTDEELLAIGFSKDGQSVYQESFKYPNDALWCKKNDSTAGAVYEGAHRAVSILQYRKAQKNAKNDF